MALIGIAKADELGLQDYVRMRLAIPEQRHEPQVRHVETLDFDGYTLEKFAYESEPGTWVPAHLYMPAERDGPVPAIIRSNGHGGSKSAFTSQYSGQLWTKAGIAVLTTDPLGEEERDPDAKMGTRTHDRVSEQAQALGRPVVGSMVLDLMAGIDILQAREEIDAERIGVAGSSLGAIVGMYLTALDDRVKCAVLSAMYFVPPRTEKFCTRGLYELIEDRVDYPTLLSLAAPRCAIKILCGDDDAICGKRETYEQGFIPFEHETSSLFEALGHAEHFSTHVYPNAGHRPYFLMPEALDWLVEHLGATSPGELPMMRLSDWADANGIVFETLYGTPDHLGGTTVPDIGAAYMQPSELACLTDEERRQPEYTTEGWLDRAAAKQGDTQ